MIPAVDCKEEGLTNKLLCFIMVNDDSSILARLDDSALHEKSSALHHHDR